MSFCEEIMDQQNNSVKDDFIKSILFSDETSFPLHDSYPQVTKLIPVPAQVPCLGWNFWRQYNLLLMAI